MELIRFENEKYSVYKDLYIQLELLKSTTWIGHSQLRGSKINSLLGGMLIGLAASAMMLFNGRITGISGILAGIIKPKKNDLDWRVAFISGLLFGGLVLHFIWPASFVQISSAAWFDYVLAGLLVGFGTLLGNGCTSGHGVCGISRLSMRSIVATMTFIFFGILSVLIFKFLRGPL